MKRKIRDLPAEPILPEIYKPTLEIRDCDSLGLGDKKIGDKANIIASYKVIDKTQNYIVLKINSVYLVPNKRSF